MKAGIVAALSALLLGAAASEIVNRQVRDLDDKGRLLHIEENEDTGLKTENRARVLEVPELLRPHLLSLAEGKEPGALLFGDRDRRWVLHWSKRLCELAGVKIVTAHGLRGSFASIARAQGAATHMVSAALGHGSENVTTGHYIQPGSVREGNTKQALSRLTTEQPEEPTKP
jgi:integrase